MQNNKNNDIQRLINLLWFNLPVDYGIKKNEKDNLIRFIITYKKRKVIKQYDKSKILDKSIDIWILAQSMAKEIVEEMDDDNITRIEKSL